MRTAHCFHFLFACVALPWVCGTADGQVAAVAGARPFQSAGNPLLGDGTYFSADAAPLSHGGKLYIHAGHDEAAPFHGGFVMHDYGVFVTDDPSAGKWTLHPRNLVPGEVFPWATGRSAYAGHCMRGKDGRFYWYVPVESKDATLRNPMAIGVAVSDSPLGPWKDPVGKPLVTWKDVFGDGERGQEVIDPHVFIDDDGKPYLYWGSWGVARVVGLADSMTETVGGIRAMEGLDAFFEAPWVFKRGGTYYLVYDWKRGGSEWTPSNYQACIGYATSGTPVGPWKFQGIILSGTSATTVHPSVIEHGGKWWVTYHTRDAVGGGHFRRTVAIDELRWDGDRILPVRQTWADSPDFRLTNNLAVDATPSASFTEQPPTTLGSLNDGRVTSVRLPPDQWGNYRGNTNTVASDWIRYDWELPVRIEGVGIEFHQDPNWSRPPARWTLEYLDEKGAWQAVRGADYPTQPDAWHQVRFEPVTTRALRATFHGQANGSHVHSVLVSEWEVHGVQAAKLPVIEVEVAEGRPVFPETVELEFPGVGALPVKLVWRELAEGSQGRAAGAVAEARAIGQGAGYIRAKGR